MKTHLIPANHHSTSSFPNSVIQSHLQLCQSLPAMIPLPPRALLWFPFISEHLLWSPTYSQSTCCDPHSSQSTCCGQPSFQSTCCGPHFLLEYLLWSILPLRALLWSLSSLLPSPDLVRSSPLTFLSSLPLVSVPSYRKHP